MLDASVHPWVKSDRDQLSLQREREGHIGLDFICVCFSISMRSVESVTSSITDSATGSGSVFSSVSSLPQGQGHSGGDKDFEELIDLSISNKTSSGTPSTTSTVTLLDNSADLVNFNKLEVEEGSEGSAAVPPPIIAFEESSTIRRQDVTGNGVPQSLI